MDAIDWAIRILEKGKRMRKGDAKTIDCPNCGEFIQLYKCYNGHIGCRCGKCKLEMRQ